MSARSAGAARPVGRLLWFWQRYRWPLLASLCVSLLAFGFMLTHYTLVIDEETWLLASQPQDEYWLAQGRFGIWLLNWLLTPTGRQVPFLWDFLAVVGLNLAGWLFAYSLTLCVRVRSGFSVFAFCAFFATLPFTAGELLDYSMFNLQISIGVLAVAGAVALTFLFYRQGGRWRLLVAGGLLFFGASVYQALVGLYAVMVCVRALLGALRERRSLPRLWGGVFVGAAVFLAALVAYLVASGLIGLVAPDGGGYFHNTYWGWDAPEGVLWALGMALANVVRVSFAIPIKGVFIYGGWVIAVCTSLLALLSMAGFFRVRGWRRRLAVFCFSVGAAFSPFLLYIALGTYSTWGRMLLALGLCGAFSLFFLLESFRPGRGMHRASVALVVLLLFYNVKYMNELFFNSYQVYQGDRKTASQMIAALDAAGLAWREKPIVWVGAYETGAGDPARLTGSCGASFFNWDDGNIARMTNFFRCEGYPVLASSHEQRARAVTDSQGMPHWPAPGSVADKGDYLLIRLSQPTDTWRRVNLGE